MISETTLVFLILAITVALFVSDRLRLDIVALLSLLALSLTGILSPAEALAGFADPVVLMIAGLFVVGGALFETGVAARVGYYLGRVAGTSAKRLTAVVMLSAGLLSGFMSSTGTVAVMLPAVASLAWKARISPSKLLIPLAFGSLLGGMVTLIGTAPNIVVANYLAEQGLEPFHFFDFTPVGLVMLLAGVAFMTLLGDQLLPSRASAEGPGAHDGVRAIAAEDLTAPYHVGPIHQLEVAEGSPLVGHTPEDAEFRRRFSVDIARIKRGRWTLLAAPRRGEGLRPGDVLFARGSPSAIQHFAEEQKLERLSGPEAEGGLDMAEVLLPPRSRLIGQTLASVRFRHRYGANVLAILRSGEAVEGDLADEPLRFGDTLLVSASQRRTQMLRNEAADFVVVARSEDPAGEQSLTPRARIALAIMIGMMALLSLELVPAVTAVLLAAVAVVLTRSIGMDDAYRAINWESVVLIAAILPMATALEKTGGMRLIVEGLRPLADLGPLIMVATLFVVTSTLSQVISNTATTVLLAPIAFGVSLEMGVSPYPFMMTIAVAASAAFATPIATPVNTLVLGPGAYRFGDFFRAGALLQGVILLLTLLIIPLLFPF